jgi:hypothetical protein
MDGKIDFDKDVVISPKQLDDLDKIKRWKDIWFSNVKISI